MNSDLRPLLQKLCNNNIDAAYVPDRRAACGLVLSLIPEGAVVGYGDSLTLRQIGVVDALEKGPYVFLNAWEPGITVEQNLERKRRSLTSDVFVTGTNALTMDGQLVNVDGHGNRVAAMLFGPKKVIVVVGVNKIVPDLDAAFARIREIAAPANVRRHTNFDPMPPCAVTGECSDCNAPWRICNKTVVIQRQYSNDKYDPVMTVIVVGEELGL
jgi:hypothetical protein